MENYVRQKYIVDSAKLKGAIKKAKISPSYYAGFLGVSPATVKKLLNQEWVSRASIYKVARALNMPFRDLIKDGLWERVETEILDSPLQCDEDIATKKEDEDLNRKDTLKAAQKAICGERDQQYGKPENNFALIADLWNNYMGGAVKFTATDVAMMMILLKVARIKTGIATADCFVDIAGYAACGAEIETEPKEGEQMF